MLTEEKEASSLDHLAVIPIFNPKIDVAARRGLRQPSSDRLAVIPIFDLKIETAARVGTRKSFPLPKERSEYLLSVSCEL